MLICVRSGWTNLHKELDRFYRFLVHYRGDVEKCMRSPRTWRFCWPWTHECKKRRPVWRKRGPRAISATRPSSWISLLAYHHLKNLSYTFANKFDYYVDEISNILQYYQWALFILSRSGFLIRYYSMTFTRNMIIKQYWRKFSWWKYGFPYTWRFTDKIYLYNHVFSVCIVSIRSKALEKVH